MTEQELQDAIVELAHLRGWMVAHFRPARTAQGWRTAVAYDAAGFPDLVLVRGNRVVFAEIKSARGRLSASQSQWLDLLQAAGQEVYVWRPDDWLSARIDRILTRV